VNFLAGRVEGRLKDPCLPLDLIWPRRAAEFGVTDQPARRVPWDVEFRDDADAPVGGVSDDVALLILPGVELVGPEQVEFRIPAGFDAEALIINQVPVQHVEL